MVSRRPSPARPSRAYRIELKPAAVRELAALDRRDRGRVGKRIESLAANPRGRGTEKLKGADDLWRVRAGDYRIVYAIQDTVLLVLVVRVGHRRDVYRQ